MCRTHGAEVGITPGPLDLLTCPPHGAVVGPICQPTRGCFAAELVDLLDIFLLQGTDGLEAAGQSSFELVSVAQRLDALPGLVLDAQGLQEEAQPVWRTVGQEDLGVFREQFHRALAISDKFGEKSELLEAVALLRFPVTHSEDDLLELVAAEDDSRLADDLSPGGLAAAVQLLHRHGALELSTVLSRQHRSNCVPNNNAAHYNQLFPPKLSPKASAEHG